MTSEQNRGNIPALCPHCGNDGTFDPIGKDLQVGSNLFCCQRRCPNPECRGHLFVVLEGKAVVASYPPIRIAFDASKVPETVRSVFEEALDCHAANCYVAAAIMVRRTLEAICNDRGATGNNLKKRIEDLSTKIVLPTELLDAMDELRLLGNDAAHVEANTFANVSKTELDVAIEFTKEIIKGLYQYSDLLGRLRALKNNSGT
ncbi:DUF4145 domain-containing protein [bacterium]|nr:DUF4145 domain-containing protein [bacterium]